MRKIGFFIFSILLAASYTGQAQSLVSAKGTVTEASLQITYSKTSSIIFPWEIVAVDRGSADVLVQKARNVENVLQVKARRKSMTPTNLTVITADGILYQFPVRYADAPEQLTLQLNATTDSASPIIFLDLTAAQFEHDALNILRHAGYSFVKGRRRGGITLSVEGIYVRGSHLYYHIHVDNNTALDYSVEQLGFYVRDNKKAKRTTFQETALTPKFYQGNARTVKAYAHEDIVICADKFTLADDRHLDVELSEKNGGRNLVLRLKNRHLLKALPLAALE